MNVIPDKPGLPSKLEQQQLLTLMSLPHSSAQSQELSDITQLPVTVCHYRQGCSKWNPIEHRRFSRISINWAGISLRSFDMMLQYMEGMKTDSGLHVEACLKHDGNETGEKAVNDDWVKLRVTPHDVCPAWSYALTPQPCRIDDDQAVYC